MRAAWILVLSTAGCRLGVAPGLAHRTHDGEVALRNVQAEVGAVAGPDSTLAGAGAFVSFTHMESIGERDAHRAWVWMLLEARYRRAYTGGASWRGYWALGGALGGYDDRAVGGGHAELGLELRSGPVAFDIGLRYRAIAVSDETFTNSLQLGLSVGLPALTKR